MPTLKEFDGARGVWFERKNDSVYMWREVGGELRFAFEFDAGVFDNFMRTFVGAGMARAGGGCPVLDTCPLTQSELELPFRVMA